MKFTFFETIGKLIVRYHSFFEEGIINTLIIAAFAVLFGTILGTLMASMRMSRILPLRWIATAYIEFIRGTPLMVQLMFIFYGLPMAGITLPDISWIPNFSRFSAGIIAMSLNSCAYTAEIIRSGVQAVDNGQMEAARSVGFSHSQAMRLVVLPQAIKNILPRTRQRVCDGHQGILHRLRYRSCRSHVPHERRHCRYIQEPPLPRDSRAVLFCDDLHGRAYYRAG